MCQSLWKSDDASTLPLKVAEEELLLPKFHTSEGPGSHQKNVLGKQDDENSQEVLKQSREAEETVQGRHDANVRPT